MSTFIYNERIVVIGGEVIMTDKQTRSSSEQLHKLSGTWQEELPRPVPLHGMAVVATETVFVIGGSQRTGAADNRRRDFSYVGTRYD